MLIIISALSVGRTVCPQDNSSSPQLRFTEMLVSYSQLFHGYLIPNEYAIVCQRNLSITLNLFAVYLIILFPKKICLYPESELRLYCVW